MSVLPQKIVFGSATNPLLTLTERGTDTGSITATLSAAVVGDEIAVDEMSATANNAAFTVLTEGFIEAGGGQVVTADGYDLHVKVAENIETILPTMPTGTPLWYYSNNALVGKFYVKSIKRLDKLRWRIEAQSIVGVLDGLQYMGRMCSGETFDTVVADILGGTTTFTVSPALAGLAVFGHFPIMSRREALHWLLFAKGANLFKDAAGDPYFDFLSAHAASVSVPAGSVFYGDTIEQDVQTSRAEITEHAFLKLTSTERVTLYDNTDGRGTAENEIVTFREPVYDMRATGTLTISESGCNHAVINGVGVLTGVPYIHTARIVAAGQRDVNRRTRSVSDVTIISLVDSLNVAQRVLAYYRDAKTARADIVRTSQKPTDIMHYTNAWDEAEQGYVSGMTLRSSSFQRAAIDLVSGYAPTGEGNNYNHAVILTGSGTWTPPAGVTRVRAVLISGGKGGGGGWQGDGGADGGQNGHGDGGEGGQPGTPGDGGRITLADMAVTPGVGIPYSCGAGGIAGAGGIGNSQTPPTDGANGGDTTFGQYSTVTGQTSPNGIANIFGGAVYALPGNTGKAGGKGGKPNAYAAEDVPPHTGGAQAPTVQDTQYGSGRTATGGAGSGATVDANGANGTTGAFDQEVIYGELEVVAYGGDGAKGADASVAPAAPAPADIGRGGTAGNGGGGGGGGASGSMVLSGGDGGKGGNGSRGGNGAAGGIILYY